MIYEACIAYDVACYGGVEIEADNTDDAIKKAKEMAGDVPLDPEWENTHSMRIVNIITHDGDVAAEDISLDDNAPLWLAKEERQLWKAAPVVLAALTALLAKHDRPHGFADFHWYCTEIDQARAAIAKATKLEN